ncbi:MAG: N-acetylglucosamine-6-phosphate deacetylase [Planctomycetota bacterium]|jgi:N-acetylglucosamine-6-phosphate deacetylase
MNSATSKGGLVDLQVNGYLGVDFSSPELTEEDFASACRSMLAVGTSVFLPTMITSPLEVYERNLPLMAKVMEREEFRGRLAGFHIEGPFISAEAGARGAHNPELIVPCDTGLLDKMIELSGDKIRLMTIGADVAGAYEFTRYAVERGVTISLGHHTAGEAELRRLAEAGAKSLTHLGNGVAVTVDRHDNPILAGLGNDDLWAMIVTDGHHLPVSLIKTIIRTKGWRRCVLVSDASPLAGMRPGHYTTLGNEVILEPGGRLYNPKGGHLVGSSATLRECRNYLAGLGVASEEEIVAMSFYNPLKLVGIDPAEIVKD